MEKALENVKNSTIIFYCILVSYLLVSFCLLNINPIEWSVVARVICCILFILSMLVSFMVKYDDDDDDKNNKEN